MNADAERAEFLRKLNATRHRIERLVMELQLALETWTEADFHRDSTLADMRQFHRAVFARGTIHLEAKAVQVA